MHGVQQTNKRVMGKAKRLERPRQKMSEKTDKNAKLKRSRSVRASIRSIGAKLMLASKHDKTLIQKTTSLPHLEGRHALLNKPMDPFKRSLFQSEQLIANVEQPTERRRFRADDALPSAVPPKAAQILQIPTAGDDVVLRHSKETPEGDLRRQNQRFHRASLRISIAARRKRQQSKVSLNSSLSKFPSLAGDIEMMSEGSRSLLNSHQQKPSKKETKLMLQRMEKLTRINIHLQALFAAVENGHTEKVRTILESTDVDVNSVNNDGLSALDIAVLNNNKSVARLLMTFGARENDRFGGPDELLNHLQSLLAEAELRLTEFGGLLEESGQSGHMARASLSSIIGNAYQTTSMSGCAGSDASKRAAAWGRRVKTLRRLVLGFAQARPPDPPSLVAVDVITTDSVSVRLKEGNDSAAIVTKFIVQWSTRADFLAIDGAIEINDLAKPQTIICLIKGQQYYFRAACGNLKGFGSYTFSNPPTVIPSTWRDVSDREVRFKETIGQLDALTNDIRKFRPGGEILESPNSQRRMPRKKTTIKQLFTAASKFQKTLKRGIYLASILYHEDKVLLTNEDFLPVIEIDETFPSCLNTDLHWLMKISCNWDDTKALRANMEKHTSSNVHFRIKLLQAAQQMQHSLCLQDLGTLFYRPIKDSNGTVVLSTVNYIKNQKNVSVLNSRWSPMNKVFKKPTLDQNISESLMASIQEQINYHQASGAKLSKGLYLAYLKMQSSVDQIQIVVPSKSPNILPHCKIRDNPHVSAEEWVCIRNQNLPDVVDTWSEQQRTFLELVTSAAKRLFNYMDISSEESYSHRLYDNEIIELTQDVSIIVVCPSADNSCSVPGQRELLLQRGDLLSLPVQVFEMVHLNTYQKNIIKRYCKLNCLLELDCATANHLHREAFSNSELVIAKERLTQLQDFQNQLNSIWKSVRWLMDLITFARDRANRGLLLKYFLDKELFTPSTPKHIFLEIPSKENKIVKTSPGRGSWPGPGANTPASTLFTEFSKSEQHLSRDKNSLSNINSSDQASRKNSDSYNNDYYLINSTTGRLPSSHSEDTLYVESTSGIPQKNQRIRSNTVSSATTSPLLGVNQQRSLLCGSLISINTANTSDSLHSISSDSDYGGLSHNRPKIVPSRSMTNVKNYLQNSGEIKQHQGFIVQKPLCNLKAAKISGNLESNLSKSLTSIQSLNLDANNASSSEKVTEEKSTKNVPSRVPLAETELQGSSTSGILQVYAAYNTGLAVGTSLKLHVTPRTTAREVIDLVVKQLNMAVVLKGKEGPIYTADKLKNFCLVAVIGARERCLRDDFKPLQLQNPWKKGRLYVRQKHDVLAALEYSSKHGTII